MDREHGHLPVDYKDAAKSLVWIKVVGLGNASVGKTSIIRNYCEGKFSNQYQATVGVDYGFKIQNIGGAEEVRVHMWDFSGRPEYADVRNELYIQTDVCLFVYDVSCKTSFESLPKWLTELKQYCQRMPICSVVANKIDIKGEWSVSTAEAKRWAIGNQFRFHETSAKNGKGIDQVFTDVVSDVVQIRKKDKTNKGLHFTSKLF